MRFSRFKQEYVVKLFTRDELRLLRDAVDSAIEDGNTYRKSPEYESDWEPGTGFQARYEYMLDHQWPKLLEELEEDLAS